jgi:hypothetical protein
VTELGVMLVPALVAVTLVVGLMGLLVLATRPGRPKFCSYCGFILEAWRNDPDGEWWGCARWRDRAQRDWDFHYVRYYRTPAPKRFDPNTGHPL